MTSSTTGPTDDLTPAQRAAAVRRLEKAIGSLAGVAIQRMEERLAWYRAMPPDNRSWIGLVVQAGIAAFVEWFRNPQDRTAISADVFGTAPRELTRSVTLRQTVELVRTTIEVVEEGIGQIAQGPVEQAALREGMLRYSREIAFAAAQVYAQAAELRGAWDARLEALVVDELMRGDVLDDTVRSRAAALGWDSSADLVVVVGATPEPLGGRDDVRQHTALVVDAVHRAARRARLTVLTGVQSDRLVVIIGNAEDPLTATRALANEFGPGALVIGPVVEDLLSAGISAQAALSALRAAPAWPDAPRPVLAAELLPERALAGDEAAKAQLVAEVYRPLEAAGAALLETVSVYLEQAASLESAARMLFVHPNTVRYRLKRVSELTGLNPAQPRAAFTLHMALALGRLAGPANGL
ncbi:helix-turn-helix domain-containing protein [Catenulispora subtropica]|uniref:Fatty acid biosynthesis transcriptional regulator FasR n=1 Tax=Catenulispora subtropica TaxID=450798 RepID=A0ABN2SJ50_9ACTN